MHTYIYIYDNYATQNLGLLGAVGSLAFTSPYIVVSLHSIAVDPRELHT